MLAHCDNPDKSYTQFLCRNGFMYIILIVIILVIMYHNVITVMFEWNARLDLSEEAATKTFGLLLMEFLLEVLCQSTWTVTIWVIRGDKGVGDIPGV